MSSHCPNLTMLTEAFSISVVCFILTLFGSWQKALHLFLPWTLILLEWKKDNHLLLSFWSCVSQFIFEGFNKRALWSNIGLWGLARSNMKEDFIWQMIMLVYNFFLESCLVVHTLNNTQWGNSLSQVTVVWFEPCIQPHLRCMWESTVAGRLKIHLLSNTMMGIYTCKK